LLDVINLFGHRRARRRDQWSRWFGEQLHERIPDLV